MEEEEEAHDTKKKRRRCLAVTSSTAGGGVGLADDLVVEILSHLPEKSICRFKCVSSSWRNLISHSDNRKKLPQTVTGFFYFEYKLDLGISGSFVSLAERPMWTGRGCLGAPSPCDFLPALNTGGRVVDCCNGLVLLLNNSGSGSGNPCASYVICNPATEKWTTVPGRSSHADKICTASVLRFDPAVSVHFHVVELLDREGDEDDFWYADRSLFEGFNVYSSETGAWVFHPHKSRHWSPAVDHRRTYLNGLLHFVTDDNGAVAALDMEGRTRRVIPAPQGVEGGLIAHSLGRLLYVNRDARNASKLSIYVLGDDGRWTLKRCVDASGLFADVAVELWSWQLLDRQPFVPTAILLSSWLIRCREG